MTATENKLEELAIEWITRNLAHGTMVAQDSVDALAATNPDMAREVYDLLGSFATIDRGETAYANAANLLDEYKP